MSRDPHIAAKEGSQTPAEPWAYITSRVWRWEHDSLFHRLKRRIWCRHHHAWGSSRSRRVCNSCAVW